jgi:bla regulator protein BlaR1
MLKKIASAVPMVLLQVALIGSLAGARALRAQNASKLTYDVSTVKPHDPAHPGGSFGVREGRFVAVNAELRNLIAEGWGVRPDQVAGEPAWADDERWDVIGKVTDADDAVLKKIPKKDTQHMEQTLLAERFHVKVHIETRTGRVLNLMPAKSGIKLKMLESVQDDSRLSNSRIPRGSLLMRSAEGGCEMDGYGIGVEMLIANIAANLQQTVIDKTGLPTDAVFDFTLKFAPETDTNTAQNGDAPPMREALEEQLGLHLEPTRGPVQIVVVDHVDKPTAN